ncbi:MAG TPA: hypothetical protein VHD83_22475 [Puia sp.]|nr:hypothetical protein [Puia sp.]
MNSVDVNSSYNSHFGVFLDNYNRGNNFLNNITGSFFELIEKDKENIIASDDSNVRDKIGQLDQLAKVADKSNYQKAAMAGSILATIARDILSSPSPKVKRSGINIINSFLNVAKETQDQQLIDTAIKISNNISA